MINITDEKSYLSRKNQSKTFQNKRKQLQNKINNKHTEKVTAKNMRKQITDKFQFFQIPQQRLAIAQSKQCIDRVVQKFNNSQQKSSGLFEYQMKIKKKSECQFFTSKDLLQKNLRSKQFVRKTFKTFKGCNQISSAEQIQNYDQTCSIQNTVVNKHHQNLQIKQSVKYLSKSKTIYSNLWQIFLKAVKTIQNNQQNLCLAHVCEQDRKLKIYQEIVKEMDFLLDQHDTKIYYIVSQETQIKSHDLQSLYLQLHEKHQKLMQINVLNSEYKIEYQNYLKILKIQQKQKIQQLNSKRQFYRDKQNLSYHNNSPLRFLNLDLNPNDKDIKQIIQKKSKLNLQVDLNFQIQQRKKISKEKQIYKDKLNKLQKEKFIIQSQINEIKQKIDFKQKQIQRYQLQKNKLQNQRSHFLKMLLKNPQFRLDGILWIFQKMIQYGHSPEISDFSQNLDSEAKAFLIHEFQLLKQQKIFKLKDFTQTKKVLFKKQQKSSNRQRVKSVSLLQSSSKQEDFNNAYFNLDKATNQNKFFTFGSKNIKLSENRVSLRKKSDSMSLIKQWDNKVDPVDLYSQKYQQKNYSFKSITKQKNSKKIYESTKKYLKNWINNQSWNNRSTKSTTKEVKDAKIPDQFISEEKTRAKLRYFKVGRSNTRYNSIIRTLYGSEQDLKATARRIKTTRQ